MSWSTAEIEQQIDREPRLGLALSQYMVRQCIELQDRIESMAIYKTPERVMLALVQLADTLGTPMSDGSTRVAALTHHTVAEYVGTSREIVTFQLNRLRRLGMLRYSRKHMDIYAGAIKEALREQGVDLPHLHATMRQMVAG
jgi:CRP-like cAMP-binding protein